MWDGSGFRADTVHAKTRALKDKPPAIQRAGPRQPIPPTLAVNAKGGFWFATCERGLNAELFIELFIDLSKGLMTGRARPVHLVVDGLPANEKARVRDRIASTNGKLRLHGLPGGAPGLNPDERVRRHAKRTGSARNPLPAGEKLSIRVDQQRRDMQQHRGLVCSVFQGPSVAYIAGCRARRRRVERPGRPVRTSSPRVPGRSVRIRRQNQ